MCQKKPEKELVQRISFGHPRPLNVKGNDGVDAKNPVRFQQHHDLIMISLLGCHSDNFSHSLEFPSGVILG
ncbi:hypothetical protein TNCV_4213131 [Trichonephila clavipes]|nr:hypothetical protein TNCV_4213131 [Trichonephila clavipes]